MPASSPSQRKLFGMVLATKRGKMNNPSAKVKKMASGISENDAKDYAMKKSRKNIAKSLMQGPSGY